MNALDRKEKKLLSSNFVFFNKEHRDKSIVLTYPSCAGCPGMSESEGGGHVPNGGSNLSPSQLIQG